MKRFVGGKHASSRARAARGAIALLVFSTAANAHVFVSRLSRVSAIPPEPGVGWQAEAWLNLPEESATDVISAAQYANANEPTFTFTTRWIDFPEGPDALLADNQFDTIGDFLGTSISDVSHLDALDEPFGHFFLRFTGNIRVDLSLETRIRDIIGLPVWVDFGTMGADGHRLKVMDTIYQVPNSNFSAPWFSFGPSIEAPGVYPIELDYFNRFNPNDEFDAPSAGIELYGFHPGGIAHPAGEQMVNERFGFGTLIPPSAVYQPEQFIPLRQGDFDADTDIDLRDFRWLQVCSNPILFLLPAGCSSVDFNADQKVNQFDIDMFLPLLEEPVVPTGGK